ncbi:MAG: DNA translocase FtsK [Synergistaceae bacterium]|jgi:S-DNA-T family DNA segregation ATPase FtsK/SpoIIIE|nr:DNA translocase FtsK [Synergistaceae bacterium]
MVKRLSHPGASKAAEKAVQKPPAGVSEKNTAAHPQREKTGKPDPGLRDYITIAAMLFLALDLCVISGILTAWTGLFGRAVRHELVGRLGGGVLIPLLYGVYVSICAIAEREIPRPARQSVGTGLLYLCSALMLGLADMTMPGRAAAGHPVLNPGSFGVAMAGWLYTNVGPLGTTIAGLWAVSLTMICFGATAPFESAYAAIRRLLLFFQTFLLSRRNAGKHDAGAKDGEPGGSSDMPAPSAGEEGTDCEGDEGDGDGLSSDCGDLDLPLPVDVVAVDEMEPDLGDARLPAGQFPPPFEVYGRDRDDDGGITVEMARPWGERIIDSLAQFGVDAELADILIGPTVIQFRVQPLPGVKVNKIVALANDLAMALAVSSLRVEAPIPGHPYVGIEIPNPKRRGITLRSIIEEDEYQETDRSLPLPMGVTINGDPLVVGLEDLPHLLVAGTTGSGKSVFVNSCIIGLCSMRKPDELKMVLVDPKRVEMAAYEKLPHILTPPVTDPKKAVHVLGWAIREMERRYSMFAMSRVRNLSSYNEIVLPKDRLPHIVIVVDELADLMMTAAKEVEEYICRLAQMARATGIHLMLATQRPSVNVITGLIKANVPARVAFTLPSMMDSRTIIDSSGAEKLLGKGDMLFLSTQSPKPVRVQSPWIDEHSITRWLDYLVNMFGEPIYTDIDDQGEGPSGFEEGSGCDDALFGEAVKVVVSTGMASASGLQRRLRIGFTRAGRLVDMMEAAGIVGPADGARPREILVDEEEAEEIIERMSGA